MYRALTHGIQVTVMPQFLEDQSSPEQARFFWAYTVEIANLGTDPVQLRSRSWRIVDGAGSVQEVSGAGVVGEEPVILPGDSYTYTSGCPLSTPDGTMSGHYVMQSRGGETFPVDIPLFPLDSPYVSRVIH